MLMRTIWKRLYVTMNEKGDKFRYLFTIFLANQSRHISLWLYKKIWQIPDLPQAWHVDVNSVTINDVAWVPGKSFSTKTWCQWMLKTSVISQKCDSPNKIATLLMSWLLLYQQDILTPCHVQIFSKVIRPNDTYFIH